MNRMIMVGTLRKVVKSANPTELADIVTDGIIDKKDPNNKDNVMLLATKILSNSVAKLNDIGFDDAKLLEEGITSFIDHYLESKKMLSADAR